MRCQTRTHHFLLSGEGSGFDSQFLHVSCLRTSSPFAILLPRDFLPSGLKREERMSPKFWPPARDSDGSGNRYEVAYGK